MKRIKINPARIWAAVTDYFKDMLPDRRTVIAMLILLDGIALAALAVNRLAPRELPADPHVQLEILLAHGDESDAERVYQALLDETPHDLDLNYQFISNHFEIPSFDPDDEQDEPLVERYRELACDPATADLGHYGLGLVRYNQKRYKEALALYRQVENHDQKYLNNSIGRVLLRMDRYDEALPYLQREIALAGNVAGATQNLVQLALETHRLELVRALLADGTTAPHVPLTGQLWVALVELAPLRYLRISWGRVLQRMTLLGIAGGITSGTIWFLYLRRLDRFHLVPLRLALTTLLAGALAALCSLLVSGWLGILYTRELGEDTWHDFLLLFIFAGLVEELFKLLPVILGRRKHKRDPAGLLILGALSALGFAALENGLYSSCYGLHILFARFWLSALVHMTETVLICYAAWRARYLRPAWRPLVLVGAFLASAVSHTLFDLFIFIERMPFPLLSLASPLIFAGLLYLALGNALNTSTSFDPGRVPRGYVENRWLLAGGSLVLHLAGYAYANWYLGTTTANQRLYLTVFLSLTMLPMMLQTLGRLELVRGRFQPIWDLQLPRIKLGKKKPVT